jgi:hypothetical protein
MLITASALFLLQLPRGRRKGVRGPGAGGGNDPDACEPDACESPKSGTLVGGAGSFAIQST